MGALCTGSRDLVQLWGMSSVAEAIPVTLLSLPGGGLCER